MMALSKFEIYGCVFDFDGTIVLSEHVHMGAWEELSAESGIPLPPMFLEESVGVTDKELVLKLADAWVGRMSADEIAIRKKKYYLNRNMNEFKLVPGVSQAIERLNREVPLAIATSSSLAEVEPILDFFKLKSFFKSIHTVETVRHAKPDPELYLNACASLGFQPRNCLAFEDSFPGSAAARAAGCRLVTVGTLYDPKLLGDAWFSIQDFEDPKLALYF